MANTSIILLGLISFSGIAAIYSGFAAKETALKIFRPLTTLLIVLLGLLGSDPLQHYNALILVGLVFAFAADLSLLFAKERKYIALGFIGFSILLYTAVSIQSPGPYFQWGVYIPVFVVAIIFMFIVIRRMKTVFFPVMILIIILSVFVMQSAGRAWYIAESGTELLFVGSICFALSAAIFLFKQLRKSNRIASVIYSVLFWSALTLITLSTY